MDKLRKIVSGNRTGPTLLFVHGWPDDATLFTSLAKRLDEKYYCVRVTLPNFGPPGPQNRLHRFGATLDDLVALLRETVIETQAERGRPDEPVSLVLHDWGCTYGYELEARHPELVRSVVALDIALMINLPFYSLLLVLAYQWYLAYAWLIGQFLPPVGTLMTRLFASIARAPDAGAARWDMNYPYFWFWFYLIFRRSRIMQQRQLKSRGLAPFPLLFLYGSRKPFLLPSPRWLAAVNARPDSETHAYEGDHWFFRRSRFESDVNDRIATWLDKQYAQPRKQ